LESEINNPFDAIREKVKSFPSGPGLYFMKDSAEKVLYIGKAKNLRSRVAGYFQPSAELASSRGPKIAEMINKTCSVDFLETKNEVDAILQEARLIKDIHPPYNSLLADDKSFPYLEITTGDDFPGVYITRKPRPKGSRLFGPFPAAKDLRQTLVVLQKIFRFRTCSLNISQNDLKRRFFRPCILYSIKQCTAPCAERISLRDYKKIISDLTRFLKSKRSVILQQLKEQMSEAAQATEYEKAAVFRDRIRLIEKLDQRGTPDENVQPEVFAADPAEALQKLQTILKLDHPIRIIEGIDVAHIAGAEAVGSLVKFIDGRPFKSGYRRFRIKTVAGIDDCAMIAEVVRRRYRYTCSGEELWPDVIVIDGGTGQLHAAQEAFGRLVEQNLQEMEQKQALEKRNFRAEDCHIISLAKRQEEIYMPALDTPLKLARNSPALQLLQYVRDEAHRFAQHYHHILRAKKMLNEKG
jgi:excinuclease ABC subunit C